jgi:hypothetical protein
MKPSLGRSILTASLALGFAAFAASPALAQAGSTTRAQVKMDRDTFLSMARWDEATGNWVLRSDMAMPEGVPTREEIKAMRDQFLSMNRWNESTSQWVPVTGAPRDMSKLSRAQVKTETVQFLKTHRFDEMTRAWVNK